VALGLFAVTLGGCGGDDGGSAEGAADGLAVAWVDPDGDPPIIGSLTVNPADSTLYIATNTGLFRVSEGAAKPEKVVGTLETPDGAGRVSESLVVRFEGPDALLGENWEDRGSTGGEPQAMTVDEDGKLYVALIDGTVKVSDDGGQTFTDQVKGGG
jgi:hypothetical protein